jgi:hypothetical protein
MISLFTTKDTYFIAEWQSPQTLIFFIMRIVDPGEVFRSAKARANFSL